MDKNKIQFEKKKLENAFKEIEEEYLVIQRIFLQGMKTFDVFQETGNRLGFIALLDQIKTFEKEVKGESI
ncbi:MAG: hypothetical protein ACTSUP_07845 [Candidatus Heimdallarchaeaceae archaeon]